MPCSTSWRAGCVRGNTRDDAHELPFRSCRGLTRASMMTVSWRRANVTPLRRGPAMTLRWDVAFRRGKTAQGHQMGSDNDKLSAEDRLIARYFAPLATHPGALGLSDDAAFIAPPPGCEIVLKTDAIIGGVHFFAEDDAMTVAQKGAAGESFRPRRQGRDAARLSVVAGAAQGGRRSLARALHAGPARGCGTLRLSAVRRRHRPHAGPDDDLGRHVRQRPRRHDGAPRRRQIRAISFSSAAASAMPRSAWRCAKAPLRRWNEAQRAHLASRYLLPQPRNALAEAVRTQPPRRWIFPTGLPAISPSSAACRRSAAEIDVAKVPLSDAARTS